MKKTKIKLASSLAVLTLFFCFYPNFAAAKAVDSDADGISDEKETSFFHTDPKNPDTDGDGINDWQEIQDGSSPRHAGNVRLSSLDSDNDGLIDSWEIRIGTDLLNPDSDNDGYSDWTEVKNSYNPNNQNRVKIEKLIKVSIADQKLAYYFGKTKLDEFKISSGVRGMETPQGEFSILDKVPSKNYGGYGYNFYYPDTKWNLHFTTKKYRYYIHGAYWHDKFGQPMSHGCVNVAYKDMEKLYTFAQVGTKLLIN